MVGRKPNGDPLLRSGTSVARLELDSDLPAIFAAWEGSSAAQRATGSEVDPSVFWARLPGSDDAQFEKDGFRLDSAYHHPARHEAIRALGASPYPARPLEAICDLRNDQVVPSKDLDETLTYVGLANIEAHTGASTPVTVDASSLRSAVKRFVGGDILFAKMRPELRKVCLVPEEFEGGYASAECLVLVPRREPATGEFVVIPELLALLLRSDLVYGQVVHLVIGIGRPRLSRSAVLNVHVPVPPISRQREILQFYQQSEEESRALLLESENLRQRSRAVLADASRRLARDMLTRTV
jgi:hypothetical protein